MQIHVTKDKLGNQPVEAGVYRARISSMVLTESKKGKDMIKVEYTLLSDMPSGKSAAGRKVFENITIEESMLWKLNDLVKATSGEDIPEQSWTEEELFLFAKGVAEQQEVTLKVKTRIYEERETNEVASVRE